MANIAGKIIVSIEANSKNFSAGIEQASASIKKTFGDSGIGKVAAGAAVAVGKVAAIVAKVVAGLAVAAIGAVYFGARILNAMFQAIDSTSAYGRQISELKGLFANVQGAVYAAFAPLITAALPYIKIVVNWLVNLLNTVAMITAALTGQSTYMKYVAGSADDAAGSAGKLADNTNKAGKAAKGALAAFDQINVLQQQSADTSANAPIGGAGGGGGGKMKFTVEPVDTTNKFVEFFLKVKKVWDEFILVVKLAWVAFWEDIKNRFQIWVGLWPIYLEIIKNIWHIVWDDIKLFSLVTWEVLKAVFGIVVTWFALRFQESVELWKVILAGFVLRFQESVAFWRLLFGEIVAWFVARFNASVELWKSIIAGFALRFQESVAFWQLLFLTAWTFISSVWAIVASWFQVNVIDPIKTGFGIALDWLQTTWESVFTGISGFVKGIVNTIIGYINGMITAIVGGINAVISSMNAIHVTIPKWVPKYGGNSFGINLPLVAAPQVPYLATGAVIPPGAAFAAILGDQRSGKNIETPEALMRQIVREEMGNREPITINFAGNLGALMRVLKPYADRESARIGVSLIQGAMG